MTEGECKPHTVAWAGLLWPCLQLAGLPYAPCLPRPGCRQGDPPVTAGMLLRRPPSRGTLPSPRGASIRRAARPLLAAGALAWRSSSGSTKVACLRMWLAPSGLIRGEVLPARHCQGIDTWPRWEGRAHSCIPASCQSCAVSCQPRMRSRLAGSTGSMPSSTMHQQMSSLSLRQRRPGRFVAGFVPWCQSGPPGAAVMHDMAWLVRAAQRSATTFQIPHLHGQSRWG